MHRTLPVMVTLLFVVNLGFWGSMQAEPNCSITQCTYVAMVVYNPPSPPKTLVDGGFEQPFAIDSWHRSGEAGRKPDVQIAPDYAHSGMWFGVLAAPRNLEGGTLFQSVTITEATPYLIYWSAVLSEKTNC